MGGCYNTDSPWCDLLVGQIWQKKTNSRKWAAAEWQRAPVSDWLIFKVPSNPSHSVILKTPRPHWIGHIYCWCVKTCLSSYICHTYEITNSACLVPLMILSQHLSIYVQESSKPTCTLLLRNSQRMKTNSQCACTEHVWYPVRWSLLFPHTSIQNKLIIHATRAK